MKSKFNSNYIYNSKHNKPKIRKLVKEFKLQPVNPQTFDFLFRFNTRNYPKTSHEELKLPGEYQKSEDTAVFVIDNGVLQMDHAESVAPGGFIKRNAINDAEHQRGKLSPQKVNTIYEYCLYTAIKHKKPCYPIVITDYDYGKEYEDYVVEGFSFRIYFRIFNEEKIYEMLNTLMDKDFKQEVLTDAEYLRLIYCIIFAKEPFAKDVIEKASNLFASMENIKFNHQLDLHLALKMTIKYYFSDDEKIEELLTMITKAVDTNRIDEFEGYEVKQYTIEELKAEKTELQTVNTELQTVNTELQTVNTELQSENTELLTKNSKKDQEIKRLKKIMAIHGIVF